MSKRADEYLDDYYASITCPICGKVFIPAVEHVWAIGDWEQDVRNDLVCSYSCMRKWEKAQENKHRQRKNRQKDTGGMY